MAFSILPATYGNGPNHSKRHIHIVPTMDEMARMAVLADVFPDFCNVCFGTNRNTRCQQLKCGELFAVAAMLIPKVLHAQLVVCDYHRNDEHLFSGSGLPWIFSRNERRMSK
jgi:hypothetical protein